MAAFVNIVGFPAGAIAYVDDVDIGITPIYYHLFKWGKYKIRIEKEGFKPEFREEFVVFKTDRKKTITYNLARE